MSIITVKEWEEIELILAERLEAYLTAPDSQFDESGKLKPQPYGMYGHLDHYE